MNPSGMFENGHRKREYTIRDVLPLSGRLIPEFDRRRSIKDMFFRNVMMGSSLQKPKSQATIQGSTKESASDAGGGQIPPARQATGNTVAASSAKDGDMDKDKDTMENPRKRSGGTSPSKSSPKRAKSTGKSSTTAEATIPGQKSLKGFFISRNTKNDDADKKKDDRTTTSVNDIRHPETDDNTTKNDGKVTPNGHVLQDRDSTGTTSGDYGKKTPVDRAASKENWTRLFSRSAPRCEGHEEPCISLTTKKAGINCGRAFWICRRPLGPSGNKEKGTQWRCSTFIWASDWNAS